MEKKLCDFCKEKEALIFIKIYSEENVEEKGLCPQCAIDYLNNSDDNWEAHLLDEKLFDMLNQMQGLITGIVKSIKEIETKKSKFENNYNNNKKNMLTCKKCGTTFEQYKESGYLGCQYCYNYFKKYINKLIIDIHRGSIHTGKRPKRFDNIYQLKKEILNLKSQLHKLVKNEKYEEALKLKNKIDQLTGDSKIGTKNALN